MHPFPFFQVGGFGEAFGLHSMTTSPHFDKSYLLRVLEKSTDLQLEENAENEIIIMEKKSTRSFFKVSFCNALITSKGGNAFFLKYRSNTGSFEGFMKS